MTTTYHNDPKFRSDYIAECRWHREQDLIIQSSYGDPEKSDFRGCHNGCAAHSLLRLKGFKISGSDKFGVAEALGWPIWLVRLAESIFEGLPNKDAKEFPQQLAQAIPCGANVDMVWPKLALWLLGDTEKGVIRFAKTDQAKKSVNDVTALYREWVDSGVSPAIEKWRAAAAAYAYANAAAYAAAAAAAAYAYANAAANAAAYAAAAADARRTHWKATRDKLLNLLAETSIT